MLTVSQQKTVGIIKDYIKKYGFSPTVSEIAQKLGIKSRGMVQRNLQALTENGVIKLLQGRHRNIQLIEEEGTTNTLPLLGRIAAGHPIEVIPHEELINIPELLLGSERYLLQVKGDSMIGDNICDGDLIVCEKAETARNGTIVVALVDQHEATLKRIYNHSTGIIVLVPSNPALLPMEYEASRVAVQGIYVGLLRLSELRR